MGCLADGPESGAFVFSSNAAFDIDVGSVGESWPAEQCGAKLINLSD
jgi:hypothetical protein